MPRRTFPVLMLVLLALLGAASSVIASRGDASLRDQVYVSPTWGHSVRWYDDEWTIVERTSQDGNDRLWLRDALGNLVGFEGRPGHGGDARACLDDQIAVVEENAAGEVVIVQDELDRPQKIFHPERSWIVLLVAYADGEQVVDHVVYLDCRTLVPDEAVFVRYLMAPLATYSDELWQLDVLNAALPRSAWVRTDSNALTAAGLRDQSAASPFPVDSRAPWELPHLPQLLTDEHSMERGIMTLVDADYERHQWVVMIENSGDEPLTIDPSQFVVAAVQGEEAPPLPDIAPARTAWNDGVAPGPRGFVPGTWGSLTLEFPDLPQSPGTTVLLYRDSATADGAVVLDCVSNCGYGGGASRPKLRIGR